MSSARVEQNRLLFVTATPPTPNGDLHLGHFSGPYLAADVFARHQRRRGVRVACVTGIDDHQSYTDARARRERRAAEEVADSFGDRIEQAWQRVNVHWDVVSRPRQSPYHRELVTDVLRRLYDEGHVVLRERPLPWCPSCEVWAYEAYVTGRCPHCDTPACGNACEVCGRPNDCADLVEPRCTACGTPCELRECARLYFPLEPHRDMLEAFWRRVDMNGHLRTLCDQMSAAGLPEIAVSHPGPWGIQVPVERFESHTIYVWFEMAAGYLATATEWAAKNDGGDWRTVWRNDTVVQFFGYDNGYFHAILFPAVMSAYDPGIALPAAFVSNEFYRLEGQKFSTSRQHAIWVDQALAVAPADHLRLYLSLDRPAATQTSFSWPQLWCVLYDDYLPRWFGWLVAAQRRFTASAELGRAAVADTVPPTRLLPTLRTLLDAIDEAYSREGFSPRRALHLLDLLAREAAEFGAEQEYLVRSPTGSAHLAAALAAEAAALAGFAAGLAPVAPAMAEQLWCALGYAETVTELAWHTVPELRPAWWEITALPDRCSLFAPTGDPPPAAEPVPSKAGL